MRRAWFALPAVAVVVAAGVVVAIWLREPGPRPGSPANAPSRSETASARSAGAILPAPTVARAPAPGVTPERRPDPEWPHQFGRVIAAAERSPIAGATIGVSRGVELAGLQDLDALALDDASPLATTDERGGFELAPELEGAILVVSAPGFGSVLCDRSWLGDSADAPLVIALERGATLHGSVVDGAGEPLADVDVRLIAWSGFTACTYDRDMERFLEKFAFVHERTDERGRVRFFPLPAGVPFQAYLWRKERPHLVELHPIELASGDESSEEWQLARGATVRGRAVDVAGVAVADLELELIEIAPAAGFPESELPWLFGNSSIRQRTDREGRFGFEDIPPGSWMLKSEVRPSTPMRDGWLTSYASIEVGPLDSTVDVRLDMRPGWTIRGTVVGPDGGAARAKLNVSGVELGPLPFLARDTDEHGRFALGPFDGGRYELFAEPREPRFTRSDPVRVAPGDGDVVLRLHAGASVRPRAVRKSDGEPVVARFTLFAEGKWESLPLVGLQPGRYDLVAAGDDGSIGFERSIVLREGADRDDLRVAMVPGARLVLNGSQRKGDRELVRLFAGDFCFASATLEGGSRLDFVVPAAPIRIARLFGFDPPEGALELKAGETREVEWPPRK